jgi:PDZ domain
MRFPAIRLTAASAVIVSAALIGPALAQTPLGVPNTGNLPPTGSPVQIEDCSSGTSGGALVSVSDRSFKVVFTNEGKVTADLVQFQIDYGDQRLAIRDVGTFTPGITITHQFKGRGNNVYSSPLLAPATFVCTVSAAHFTDGTLWTAEAAAADRTARLHGNGYLGIDFRQSDSGVVVAFLMPTGPGRKAGLKQDDLIETIDEQRVATTSEALRLISACEPGTPLAFKVVRGGQEVKIMAVVAAAPAQSADTRAER